MTTIVYFIMACSFILGAYTTAGLIFMAFSIWGLSSVTGKGWAIWFISYVTFLLCLWQQGYIA